MNFERVNLNLNGVIGGKRRKMYLGLSEFEKAEKLTKKDVKIELAELKKQRKEFSLFIHSDKFLELSEMQQNLLRNRLDIMSWDIGILRERLRLWEE